MAVNPKKDALTSNDLAGAIPEDFVGAVNKNAKFAPGDVAYCRAFACNARVMSVGTTKSGICNYKVALYDAKGMPTGEAVCSESDLVRRSVRGLKLTGLASGASRACDVAATILEKMVQRNKVDLPLAKKMLRLTQRDFPDARVSVAAAKLNENPPALLSAAKILRAEANRLRAQGKSIKLTTTSYSKWYTVVSYQLSPLRTVIDTLKTTNKLDTSKLGGVIGELNDAARNGTPDVNSARPALKQAVSMLQGVWRDASGKEMTPELKTRLLRTLGQTLNIVSKALRSIEPIEGKSMKAMRAAVKRAPAEALPMIAPLHSKLLMVYRKFIGSPETASLGSLPALAAQWKAVGNKLPDEEQSGVDLIVRDLISAYRSFTKEQMKNVAYFLAMALGTANKMVGGSANVPIPAHLRAVKGEVTRKVVLNNARKRFLDNYKFKVADAEYEKPNPAWQGGKRLPTLLSAADVTSKVNEYIFANSGARYGKLIAMDMNAYASFITKIAANQGSALGIHHLFGNKPGGFANADTIVRIGANAWNEYSTKFNASIQNKPAN